MRRSATVRARLASRQGRLSTEYLGCLDRVDEPRSAASFVLPVPQSRCCCQRVGPALRVLTGEARNCIRERNAAVGATPIAAVVVCL
jgi:hypothetical protein